MAKAFDLAELAARLCTISHFRQSDADFRMAHFERTGNYYSVASPYACASDAQKLIRLAATARRWAELQCNGIPRWQNDRVLNTWTEVDDAKMEKAKARVVEKANAIGLYYDVTFTAHGDPRGCVLKMHMPTTGGYSEEYGIA